MNRSGIFIERIIDKYQVGQVFKIRGKFDSRDGTRKQTLADLQMVGTPGNSNSCFQRSPKPGAEDNQIRGVVER